MNTAKRFLLGAFLCAGITAGWSQVTLSTSPYTQNFNSVPGASGTSYPAGWTSYNGTSADNGMITGSSSSTTGANYNYSSRIGILGSGSNFDPGSIVLAITNTSNICNLAISYSVVKIREQSRDCSFHLQYSTTSPTSGFSNVSGGTYNSGSIAQNTVTNYTNLDISALDNRSGVVYLRWYYASSGSGSRDGIALDNVSISWTSCSTPVPEINIRGNGASIASGDLSPSATDHTDFGSTPVGGAAITRVFTIQNTGTAALGIGALTITGANASDFSVVSSPASSVAAGSSATFSMAFNPSAVGVRNAGISLVNNDSDENPYTFAIRGNGLSNCTTPDALEFVSQPSSTQQSIAMSSVQVRAYCTSDGQTATGYTGPVTLSVLSPGCGYTAQTVNAVNGIADFSSVIFLRSPQTNLQMVAVAAGLSPDTSSVFSITVPPGNPVTTWLRDENFESSPAIPWSYSIGSASVTGSGGSSGTDMTGTAVFSGNTVLAKSYSLNNSSGEKGSINTVTFANVGGLNIYDYVTFSFKIASLGSGSGAGNDNGEDFILQVSTDNGSSWQTILTEKGGSNRLFSLSASPVTGLSLGNSTYTSGSLSAFSLQLNGISNFAFRFTASNNRSNESWVIDDVRLSGTVTPPASSFGLPLADAGPDITICNGSGAQLSVNVTSFQAPLSYSWTPAATLNNASLANPVASPLVAQTYTVTISDGHQCRAGDQVDVLLHGPGGTAGLWTGAGSRDWFDCFNWDNGQVPVQTTPVEIPSVSNNPEIDQAGAEAASLSVHTGALLEINDPAATLDLYGSYTNNGTLLHTAGAVTLKGSGNAVFSGNNLRFFRFRLDNPDTLIMHTSVSADSELVMIQGNILTLSNIFTLGSSIGHKGLLLYTSGHINGTMKRWFSGVSSGVAEGLFPLGVNGNDRFVTVEYTSAPASGGSLTAHFEPVAMGLSGLPLSIAAAGSCTTFQAENTQTEGYWQMDAGDGLGGGLYTITLVGESLGGISDMCELSAIKRVGGGPWQQSGTHQQPQGSLGRPVLQRTGASGWSNWGFSGGLPNPLPVQMGSLEVRCTADGIPQLVWETYTEINNAFFSIETSTDASVFSQAGTVAGAGNTNEPRSYIYDLGRGTSGYIRLVQTDYNGDMTIYGPLSIPCKPQGEWSSTWNGGTLQLYFGETAGTCTIGILDMAGRLVRSEKCTCETDGCSWQANLYDLKPGVYVLQAYNGTRTYSRKFVKP